MKDYAKLNFWITLIVIVKKSPYILGSYGGSKGNYLDYLTFVKYCQHTRLFIQLIYYVIFVNIISLKTKNSIKYNNL